MEKAKKEKKDFPQLSKIILALLIAPVIIAAIILTVLFSTRIGDNTTVATVKNQPISAGELKDQMTKERFNAVGYFENKYKAKSSDKDFWTTKYDGQTPLEYLRKIALEGVKKNKIQQILMKENGIIKDISYKAFVKNLETENIRRKAAVENGQVIYGPKEFSLSTYLDYVMSNNKNTLIDKLSQSGGALESNDTKLKAYYESIKETLYKKEDTITVKVFSVEYNFLESTGKLDEAVAKEMLQNVLTIVKAGKSDYLAQIKAKYPKVKISDFVSDNDNASGSSKSTPIFFGELKKLKKGEVSPVFNENGSYIVIRCTERKTAGYKAFDEFKDSIKMSYESVKYDEYINKLNAEVVAEPVKGVFDRVKIN